MLKTQKAYSYVRTSGFRATVTLFIVFYIINSTKYIYSY
jgi:hypothetical protein